MQAQADNRFYNGATFDGYRRSAAAAVQPGQHVVLQHRLAQPQRQGRLRLPDRGVGSLSSTTRTSQYFVAESFNQATGTFVPAVPPRLRVRRLDLEGQQLRRLPARQVRADQPALRRGRRPVREPDRDQRPGRRHGRHHRARAAGRRPASTWSGDGKTLLTGSDGRFYTGIIQSFSDGFADVPQQANYDNFAWNGRELRVRRTNPGGRHTLPPNLDLEPVVRRRVHHRRPAAVRPQHGRGRPLHRPRMEQPHRRHPHDQPGQLSIKRVVVNYDAGRAAATGGSMPPSRSGSRATGTSGPATPTRKTEGNHFDATLHAAGRLHRRPVPHHPRRHHRHGRRDLVPRGPERRQQVRPSRSTTGRTTSS